MTIYQETVCLGKLFLPLGYERGTKYLRPQGINVINAIANHRDTIGLFLKGIGNKFTDKSSSNLWQLYGIL